MDPSSSSNTPPRRNTRSPNLESRTTTTNGNSNSNSNSNNSIPDSAFTSTGFYPLRSSLSASYRLGRTPLPPAPPTQLPLPTVLVSPPPAPTSLQLPPTSSSDAATMSAVAALQFDPVFGMGGRTSYSSWPVIESNNHHGLLGHDLALSYASDTSLSPPTASRSITASPPHHSIILSTQQRELKRQREQVRREAKVAARRQASSSTPGSSPSQRHSAVPTSAPGSIAGSVAGSPSSFLQSPPPPANMADLSASSATGGLPGIYGTTSSAPSQMPLLSEPATTSASLGSPSYLATGGSYSSPMHDHQQSGVFSTSYQSQGYMPEYTTASFPASAPTTLHSQYPRGMHDQQNLMYHMPPPSSSSMMSPNHISHHHQQTAHQQPLPQQLAHHQQPQHRSPHHGGPHHQTTPPLPPHAHAHNGAAGHHHPYEGGIVGSAVGSAGPAGVRVVQSRPKPQCWEHGCNGRQFSTFSNLLRHQREKSGQSAKAVCPNCGAEFTRTTARNGHLQHDKCRQRRSG